MLYFSSSSEGYFNRIGPDIDYFYSENGLEVTFWGFGILGLWFFRSKVVTSHPNDEKSKLLHVQAC